LENGFSKAKLLLLSSVQSIKLLNTPYFIARRFTFDKEGSKSISRSIVQISVFAISLSLAVMLITISVVIGFKKEIRNKVIGFGSHIQIINLDSNNSFESEPISANQDFLPELKSIPGVKHVQVFATKAGIIRSQTEIQGVFVKGVGKDFDWNFFNENMVEGRSFKVNDSVKTNDVVVSKKLAALLKLKLNDDFAIFFIDERPRIRKFHICGLFETSLEEFDRQFILADIGHVQKLYNWDKDQISGFEILIDDYDQINQLTEKIRELAGFRLYEDGSQLRVISIMEKYPQVFSWLGLLDMNVIVILILMSIVAIINMISGLIILILDRTKSIGLLKALGANNAKIKKIFIYQSFFLILKGMIIGNVIAVVLCLVQDKFRIIRLDQASYFISYVPINFSIGIFFITNALCFALILISMYLPTLLISRIDPAKTLHYE
jgi:lipoprotein-releasing system permease protein